MLKWPTLSRRRQPSVFAVDRFSMLDGCLVVTGWAENEVPVLMQRGRPVRGASYSSFAREDLSGAFGPGTEARGFRISAAFAEAPDESEIALKFRTAEVTPRSAALLVSDPTRRTDGFHSIIGRFVAEMTPARPRLLEIGSRARSGGTYREMFPSWMEYSGLDVTDGPNVDVVGDAHHLTRYADEAFDFVFSVSVFEHLLMPWAVAIEMSRAMKVGGLAYIQSHSAWPLHDEPWDFFRFSRESWSALFNHHTGFEIVEVGYDLPASIVPRYGWGGTISGLDKQPAFLLSACLARKIAAPRVEWAADPTDVLDLGYSHGSHV